MGMIRTHERDGIKPDSTATDWTIGVVRRSLHQPRGCNPAPKSLPTLLADLEKIGALFRNAQQTMLGLQGAGLVVASPGTTAITHHERRLVRAAAAAQADDEALVDNFLFKLAPHPGARPHLADAVTALATSLAANGHWFAAFPLPAPALQVARLHGADFRTMRVAWVDPDRNHYATS